MKYNYHLAELKWHRAARVVPYIDFDRGKLLPLYGSVLHHLKNSVDGKTFFTGDVNRAQ